MTFFSKMIETPSYIGKNIKHLLSGDEDHNKLMVLLPGRGYYVDAPLLHYTRKLGWSLGYDVLSLVYGFQATQQGLNSADLPGIQQECRLAIETVLASGYDEVVLVGKSLGTPMAALFANEIPAVTKAILLTPIQNCHKLIESTPALAVIGTADPVWEDGIAVDSAFVTWRVFADLDHSLEYLDDVAASIRVLGEIMQACKTFLTTPI